MKEAILHLLAFSWGCFLIVNSEYSQIKIGRNIDTIHFGDLLSDDVTN